MNDLEAVMWRAEADARLRSAGVVLELLDTAPEWQRFLEAHRWGARYVPRLAQRVSEDPLGRRAPEWVPVDLDVEYHVERIRLADGEGLEAVLRHAATMHMEPFDIARPLWRGVLIEGLPDGKAAYVMKFHHSLADGQGGIQLFDLMHSTTREPTKGKPTLPAAPRAQQRNLLDSAAREGVDAVRGAVGTAARLAKAAGSQAVTTVTHPDRIGEAVGYVKSLAKVSKPVATPSPLLRERGLARRLRMFDVPFADLRAAGKAVGGSLNDAYLAALLGGLSRYHQELGSSITEVPMGFPVSLRTEAAGKGGNHFAGAFIAGPLDIADPAERIAAVRTRARAVRDEPALDFSVRAAPLMRHLPAQVLAGISLRLFTNVDLQASNIPGLRRDAYLAGAKVEKMYIFGPVPGCAIMATMVTHQDWCGITLATDLDAVPDADLLLRCVQESFDDVLALAKP